MRLVWTQTWGLLICLLCVLSCVKHSQSDQFLSCVMWFGGNICTLLCSLHFWCFWVVCMSLHTPCSMIVDGVISNSWVKGWVWRLSGVLSPCGGSSLHHPPAQPRWASNESPPAPASSQWGASEPSNSSVIVVSCGLILQHLYMMIHIYSRHFSDHCD